MANLNLEQILDQFQNGERRYNDDEAFKAAIDSLKMGLGVYGVLDHILAESTRIKEMHRNLIFKYTALESRIEMQAKHIYDQELLINTMCIQAHPNELNDLRKSLQDRDSLISAQTLEIADLKYLVNSFKKATGQ